MKLIRYLLVIGVVGWSVTSCEDVDFGNEFLEKPPSVDVTADTIFNSLETAERYLWGGYRTLPYGLNTDWSAKGNKLGMQTLEPLTDLAHCYMGWGGVP
ncbi:MAG: RagB/SusD family nutrient uptake outer membrane protein, partial [Bacteroidota bacterium]